MFPSWSRLSKGHGAHAAPEPSVVSLQSAVHTTDDNHNENQDICDRSIYATPIAQDTLDANPFTVLNVASPEHSTVNLGIFRTPHDDILADLQGFLPLGAPPEQPLLRPDVPQGSSSNLGSSATATSEFTTESLPSQEPAKEIMYDPSTGQRLYDYVPAPARSGADEELWSHLSHILELQSEIAKMHVDMENVGLQDARSHDGPVNSEIGAQTRTARGETGKNRRSELPEQQEEDDETDEATGGESDGDDEAFGKKKREEEFTRLAKRFEKRKIAIDSVMDKLDNLSTVLKAFHALPTPELDLTSSCTDTILSNTLMTTPRPGVVTSTTAPPYSSAKPLVTPITDDLKRVDINSPLDIHPTLVDHNLEMG